MFKLFRIMFSWKVVDRKTTRWTYLENTVTGKRIAYRNINGGWIPRDDAWLKYQENCPASQMSPNQSQ